MPGTTGEKPQEISWTPNVSTAKSLCASTVAFRPGSDIGEVTPDPSVDVSAWGDEIDLHLFTPDGDGVRMNAFGHEDANRAFDPLSANRRFYGTADLAVLGTLVFAGPTRESIDVMVPDCIVPPASGLVRIDLPHHVSLSLGSAVDMSNWVPETQLEKDTLGLQRRDYWEELNHILKKWKSVNNSRCPECVRAIKVNRARHLRLVHTKYVCFWRCPVLSCSLWFTSELNAKDHIEGIHHFEEGHGMGLLSTNA